MKRVFPVASLLAVVVLVVAILWPSSHHQSSRTIPQAPPVTKITKVTTQVTVDRGADGGSYYNPNCPKGLQWVMSEQKCVPPWHPGEP